MFVCWVFSRTDTLTVVWQLSRFHVLRKASGSLTSVHYFRHERVPTFCKLAGELPHVTSSKVLGGIRTHSGEANVTNSTTLTFKTLKKWFKTIAPKLWNSLPDSVRESKTLSSFKRFLNTYFFIQNFVN